VTSATESSEPTGSGPVWGLFLGLGVLFVVYGVYAMTLPILQPGHWDDITSDPDAVSYISVNFQWLGLLGFGLGILTMVAAYAAFRRGARWAWYAFWLYPLLFLLAIPFTWIGIGWSIFLLASSAGLLGTYRRFFPETA
jgi:hypothetical protein